MESPLFDTLYQVFISATKDTETMEKMFDKHIEKDEKGFPIFLDEEKIGGAEFSLDMFKTITEHFNGFQLHKTVELLTKKYVARDIAEKYEISYPTIMTRLPKYFKISKEKHGRTYPTVLIPRLDILVGLVVYFYFRDTNSKHKNLFVDLSKVFDKN